MRGSSTYTYDGNSQVVTQADPPITDRVTGAVHTAVTTTTYDADGNLLSQTVSDPTGSDAARTSSSTYNNYGEVASESDANGNTTTSSYDAYGNRISETAPDTTKSSFSAAVSDIPVCPVRSRKIV